MAVVSTPFEFSGKHLVLVIWIKSVNWNFPRRCYYLQNVWLRTFSPLSASTTVERERDISIDDQALEFPLFSGQFHCRRHCNGRSRKSVFGTKNSPNSYGQWCWWTPQAIMIQVKMTVEANWRVFFYLEATRPICWIAGVWVSRQHTWDLFPETCWSWLELPQEEANPSACRAGSQITETKICSVGVRSIETVWTRKIGAVGQEGEKIRWEIGGLEEQENNEILNELNKGLIKWWSGCASSSSCCCLCRRGWT